MTQLTLATTDQLETILRLVEAFHKEEGIEQSDETRRNAVLPLLEGSPYGAIYVAGPMRAPIGYLIVTFGWSVEFGGMDGFVDEIYVRPGVRGRGIGSDLLRALPKLLTRTEIKAIHLEVSRQKPKTRALYEKMGFQPREDYMLMTRRF